VRISLDCGPLFPANDPYDSINTKPCSNAPHRCSNGFGDANSVLSNFCVFIRVKTIEDRASGMGVIEQSHANLVASDESIAVAVQPLKKCITAAGTTDKRGGSMSATVP
jgi:hypothetical protein